MGGGGGVLKGKEICLTKMEGKKNSVILAIYGKLMKVDCKKEKIEIVMWSISMNFFPLIIINLHLYNHVFDYSCHERDI